MSQQQRLVDANELRKCFESGNPGEIITSFANVLSIIDRAPTVNAVVLDRCEKCRYFSYCDFYKRGYCKNPKVNITGANYGVGRAKTDYCSFIE